MNKICRRLGIFGALPRDSGNFDSSTRVYEEVKRTSRQCRGKACHLQSGLVQSKSNTPQLKRADVPIFPSFRVLFLVDVPFGSLSHFQLPTRS